jgi:SOS response regulatory protein OraA/RecX
VDLHAGDEEARAGALAESRASRMCSIDPQKAYSRLMSLLMRRGFGPDVARAAARRALALDIADDGASLASGTERP